jgi:hypothetical protein
VLFAAMAFCTGCSTFNRDWDSAMRREHAGVAGCWSGTWTSESTGQHGRLRCMLTPRAENSYDARFHATYCGIIPFEQNVVFAAENQGGLWRFRGEEDLGWLAGGGYQYSGEASDQKFMARYTSAKDRGIFEMTRPK